MTTGLQVISESVGWEPGPAGTTGYDLYVNGVKKSTTSSALSAKFAVANGDEVKVVAKPSGKLMSIKVNWTRTDTPAPPPSQFDKIFDASKDTNFNAFFDSLMPGMKVGLKGDILVTSSFNNGGAEGLPITLVSVDKSNPAIVRSYFDARGQFAYTIWDTVRFLDSPTNPHTNLFAFGGHHNQFFRSEISVAKANKIGLNMIWDSYYGTSHDNRWAQCYFHDIGDWSHWTDPNYYDQSGPGYNQIHAVYDFGHTNIVEDSIIAYSVARGLQARGSNGSIFRQNIVAYCGCGALCGDAGAVDNKFYKNIFAYCAQVPGRSTLELFDPYGTCFRNIADDNIYWGGSPGTSVPGKFDITNLRKIDPMFKDASKYNFKPMNAAVAGYGPTVWPALAPA